MSFWGETLDFLEMSIFLRIFSSDLGGAIDTLIQGFPSEFSYGDQCPCICRFPRTIWLNCWDSGRHLIEESAVFHNFGDINVLPLKSFWGHLRTGKTKVKNAHFSDIGKTLLIANYFANMLSLLEKILKIHVHVSSVVPRASLGGHSQPKFIIDPLVKGHWAMTALRIMSHKIADN